MECFEVPCEHIIVVLVLNNVHEIPRKVCKIACHSTQKFQFARDIAMMLKHIKNEDAADTSFPPEGPSNKGGTASTWNPRRCKTKGNSSNGGKKTQCCRLCREVGHNRTTCLDRRTLVSSTVVVDDLDSMDTEMVG
ncbi:uncharacterized protein LOC107491429 [Arachis duranensis]|uniref:Uncharacterized protein LOC107491429 n=1 Tax=Arachis duranensis TaxID=130453 RepID=A0A6P4DG46_ARADU|nr:uncharacterized protein LOC107491429 [Arachis duranensis]